MPIPADGHREQPKATRIRGPIPKHELQQTARHFQSLYENDVPFFDKQHICRISRQLADATAKKTAGLIRVDGLDGEPVEFEVHIGKISPSFHHGLDQIVLFAFLSYNTPEILSTVCGDDSMTSYCSIRIMVQVATLRAPTEPLPSLEVTRAIWDRQRQAWETSESSKHLKDALIMPEIPKISKVVGFALGRFATHDMEDPDCLRSSTQHLLAVALRELLQKVQSAVQLPCYVQDTAYRDIDKAILGESHLTVLDDPNGFLEVDDESAIVSFYPDCPVKEIVHDLANPGLIIWDTISNDDAELYFFACDPTGPRVKKWLLENYDAYSLCLDKKNFGPCMISMYVRRKRPGVGS